MQPRWRRSGSKLEPQYHLAGARRRVHVVLVVRRNLVERNVSESARQYAVLARGRGSRIRSNRIRQRDQPVKHVEELHAEAHRHLFAPDGKSFAKAHRFARPPLTAEIAVIISEIAEYARGLIDPGRRVENRLNGWIVAAAVQVLEIERLAGHTELTRSLTRQIGAQAVVRSGRLQQLTAGILQDGSDRPAR